MPVLIQDSAILKLNQTINDSNKLLIKELYDGLAMELEPIVSHSVMNVKNDLSQNLASLRRGEEVPLSLLELDLYKKYLTKDLTSPDVDKQKLLQDHKIMTKVIDHFLDVSFFPDDQLTAREFAECYKECWNLFRLGKINYYPCLSTFAHLLKRSHYQPKSVFVLDLTTQGIEPNPGPNGRNPKNKNKNKNRRRPRPNISRNNLSTLSIMPSVKRATLKYFDASTVRNAPGNTFLVYAMRINDLFDPDPLILSGSVSNFKEMMQFYSSYRVLTSHVKWTVVNLETFPLSCGVVFSQTNLSGTIATLGDAQNAFENDFSTEIITISGRGGLDRTTFDLPGLSIGHLLGVEKQYRSDIAYAGQGLATPSIPLWANFIVFSPTGAAMANGYANNSLLNFKSEFFARTNVRA